VRLTGQRRVVATHYQIDISHSAAVHRTASIVGHIRATSSEITFMRRSTLIALTLTAFTLAGGPLVSAASAQSAPPPAAAPGDTSGPPPAAPGSQLNSGAPSAGTPPAGAPDARRQAIREQIKAARDACRDEAKAQGLTGPDGKQHVQSCFAAKMPQVAKRIECRQEGIAKGLAQPALRDYVRQCLGTKG
jgi:hypothetical protein